MVDPLEEMKRRKIKGEVKEELRIPLQMMMLKRRHSLFGEV